jgi:hypothetical protein
MNSDRHVAIWNRELLAAAGLLSRAAYELELASVAQAWASTSAALSTDASARDQLTERALHALRFFTFRNSTPSPLVSSEMERAFFACGPTSMLPIPSSTGPRPAGDVRLPDARLISFLPRLPVIPASVLENAAGMVEALQREGALKPIGIQDIMAQLRAQPLSDDEGEAFVRWWVGEAPKHGENPSFPRLRTELMDAAVLMVGSEEKGGKMIPLSAIQSYVDARRTPGVHIPLDGPLPPTCLPPSLGGRFRADELKAAFPWVELSISAWLAHVVDPVRTRTAEATDVTRNREWAERVLQVVGKAWANIGKEEQDGCVAHLRTIACVPTTAGIRIPTDAYFPSVSLFPDLPIVQLQAAKSPGVDKVLTALGVRKHVELQIVFDRMIKTGDWTVPDLVKYLASVQGTLSEKEWKKLRATAAFLAEVKDKGQAPVDGQEGKDGKVAVVVAKRWNANQLYEPIPALREMGLPILDWQGARWRNSSEEGEHRRLLQSANTHPTTQPSSCSA